MDVTVAVTIVGDVSIWYFVPFLFFQITFIRCGPRSRGSGGLDLVLSISCVEWKRSQEHNHKLEHAPEHEHEHRQRPGI
jgi:hypothetical protein